MTQFPPEYTCNLSFVESYTTKPFAVAILSFVARETTGALIRSVAFRTSTSGIVPLSILIDLSAAAVKKQSTVALYEVLSSVPAITTEGVTVTVKLLTPSIIVKLSSIEYSAVLVVPGVNVPEVNAATIEGSVATLLKLIDTPKLPNVGTKLVVDPPAGVILILNVNVPLLSVLSDELNTADTAPNEF